MNLVLDITTSAEFWRRRYPTNRAPKNPSPFLFGECASNARDALELAPAWATSEEFLEPIGGRLHVLTFDPELRRRSSTHVAHVWKADVPEGSFYGLGNNVFVAAPGFMFLVAASTLSTEALIAFGCELCGLYGFDCSEERGFRKREVPLTTVEKLRNYLMCAKGCPGFSKAMLALSHVVDNSASPMETFDVLALCLPYRLGGYKLPWPIMNQEVPLNARAARIAKRSKCFADMCFPTIKLDVEHHGKLDHSSEEDKSSDRARVNALKEMGYEVIELTYDQVDDLIAFEYIIQRIAKLVGKRLDKNKLGATPARLAFRKEVFGWNQSSGRLR